MIAAEIIESAVLEGVRLDLTAEGQLHYSGDADVIAQWLPVIRENKPGILIKLRWERKRAELLAMLNASPDRHYSILVDNASIDPVIVAVGIRGISTFELEIPRKYYDGLALLELIEKHTGGKYANT
ncbi:hypothetical protein EBAPG3_013850 [Nitrosospira lacus]|uniref:Uncharacterized protein n=1 Tax=Nitrosospira lacus TaxID=1288494 RepID=A0A1W6SSH4_9PROT|nr:hypothetical protein [Nitrosospira lacus]ARO88764.1 hypothetical protein EBAPG3_013850 [Nitrosospira lacus]